MVLVDASGRPLAPVAPATPANRRTSASLQRSGPYGNTFFPYDAANWQTQEMGDWLPWIRSPDSEINQFRDRMVARARDLVRNDGWASGGIMRILDNTIGTSLRLSSAPDWRALSRYDKAFDATWANEYRTVVEALYRNFSDDLGNYNDVSRQLTVGQQDRLGMAHKLIDGDALTVAYWLPERIGRGAAQYATSFLVVDPDRLSNPYQQLDTRYLRGGVEIDDYGVPIAYHIRKAHQNDWYNAVESMDWERVEREDPDGWRRVFHDFERQRAGQNRGISIFTAILGHMKMLARHYGVELQAATIAATFGTYVTSPYDPSLVQDALDGGDQELSFYQGLRADWANERPAMLNGARVPTLAPGEDIKSVASSHPHGDFTAFASEMLGLFSANTGISREQVTQDWSKTNYSSARAALLESWKTLQRRAGEYKRGTATPKFAAWLSEAMDRGDLDDVLPRHAPDFVEAATAYAKCSWLGVARGWIDPVKEPQGSILRMDGGLSTLKQECAEQGLDYEEVLHQRAVEQQMFEDLKLPKPNWFGNEAANQASQPPEEPQPQ
ncbi:phage portal protein [Caballeronia sp. LZ033]|nr:phage portal protein [Caballeronia sp. LZ033]